jgi:nitric oxide reductase subunit C
MLSKSQARLFFVVATGAFSFVFLGLTVDTVSQVPARSHEENLTPEVVHGKRLWEDNNCMGCHTLLGEGAYYAPELTKVVERRGAQWIDVFLKDPEAMFPGERKMVKYDFTDEERRALIAFFTWIGGIDTNGFPAKPDMAPPASAPVVASSSTAKPAPATFTSVCQACHQVGGKGGAVGPALDGMRAKYDAAALDRWLKDPQAVKPGTAMPNLALPDDVRASLVDFLLSL